jgi:hypothetical protein
VTACSKPGGVFLRRFEREVDGARVLFLGSVRGLMDEAAEVRAAFEEFKPELVALPVGPREVEEIVETLKEKGELPGVPGNRAVRRGKGPGPTGLADKKIAHDDENSDYDDFGLFLSSSDLVFMRHLSKFGDVEMPAPSYQEVIRIGHKEGVPVEPIDFNDDEYTTVFLRHVSAFRLFRQGNRLRKLAKRRFKAQDPEAFAAEWDSIMTGAKGYAEVERAREEKIASGIMRVAAGRARVMAIVELERSAGILSALERMLGAGRAPRSEGR